MEADGFWEKGLSTNALMGLVWLFTISTITMLTKVHRLHLKFVKKGK
jgi:hypothetical protein